jgi:hypothetical protein
MNVKWYLPVLILLVAACAPAVSPEVQRDLFVDAQSSRLTADAALQQAQLQEQFLTATAQAPIVHITETAAAQAIAETQSAAAMAMQQQYWTATAQQAATDTAVPLTQTAQWWTPTPDATQTAAFAVLSAQQTQVANQAIRDNLQREREEIANQFWAIIPGVAIVVGILGLVVLLMILVRRQRFQPAQVDARGNVLPILDIVEADFTDIDRSPNFQGTLSKQVLTRVLAWWIHNKLGMPPQLPEVTARRQDDTTQRDQLLDLATRGLPDSQSSRKEVKKLAGQEMTRQLTDSILTSRYKVLEPGGQDLEVIDSEVIQVLDQDWREASKK